MWRGKVNEKEDRCGEGGQVSKEMYAKNMEEVEGSLGQDR